MCLSDVDKEVKNHHASSIYTSTMYYELLHMKLIQNFLMDGVLHLTTEYLTYAQTENKDPLAE